MSIVALSSLLMLFGGIEQFLKSFRKFVVLGGNRSDLEVGRHWQRLPQCHVLAQENIQKVCSQPEILISYLQDWQRNTNFLSYITQQRGQFKYSPLICLCNRIY